MEQQAQDFGTARDGLQLRDAIQQLMRELYGQIQLFNRECMTLENIVNRTDVSRGGGGGGGRGKQGRSSNVEVLEGVNAMHVADLFIRLHCMKRYEKQVLS